MRASSAHLTPATDDCQWPRPGPAFDPARRHVDARGSGHEPVHRLFPCRCPGGPATLRHDGGGGGSPPGGCRGRVAPRVPARARLRRPGSDRDRAQGVRPRDDPRLVPLLVARVVRVRLRHRLIGEERRNHSPQGFARAATTCRRAASATVAPQRSGPARSGPVGQSVGRSERSPRRRGQVPRSLTSPAWTGTPTTAPAAPAVMPAAS